MNESLRIDSDGPGIVSTNFWTLPMAARGMVILSPNAGAFRLLLPTTIELDHLGEMATAREVVIRRGPGDAFSYEILFDDGTMAPFALHLAAAAVVRQVPPSDASATVPRVFTAWGMPMSPGGISPRLLLSRPAYFLTTDRIPDLRPRPRR